MFDSLEGAERTQERSLVGFDPYEASFPWDDFSEPCLICGLEGEHSFNCDSRDPDEEE